MSHALLDRIRWFAGMALFLAGTPELVAATSFQFKEPNAHTYLLETPAPRLLSAPADQEWITAVRKGSRFGSFKTGSRVIVQLQAGGELTPLIAGKDLTIVGQPAPGLFVLQAQDAWHAAAVAQQLAGLPGVLLAMPLMQPPLAPAHEYAIQPNDPYFKQQWHLENRATNGSRLGPDINARAAWPHQNGFNIVIAVVDVGIDLSHPELTNALAGMPHFNFYYGITNGGPATPVAYHGTAVAGLAAARGRNQKGISGLARNASIASWTIFDFNAVASALQLGEMFQYQSNIVSVQNHSWSVATEIQVAPSALEQIGISNAITLGRDGKGVIMVRSAGNNRQFLVNANDDGYANDPRFITVGAVRRDGQGASYSNPGACLLLAAPSGDPEVSFAGLLTTDLSGSSGLNGFAGGVDQDDYTYLNGTSASAPLVSGIAALLLEANPALTYRDVQHILVNSARQTDSGDLDLQTNQAGYAVSHYTGFGVPDAGKAVRLAHNWPLRPPSTNLIIIKNQTNQIPNQGLRLQTFGTGVPLQLASIPAAPAAGQHPADLSPFYPLTDVGYAAAPIAADLTGRAALIRKGTNSYAEKIQHAAAAGASMAVIANTPGDDQFELMTNTYRSAIPAFFIKGADGTALRNFVATNATGQVRSILFQATITNEVTTPLLVEHIAVRLKTDHFMRGDLRIVIESPSGLRSELQHPNKDQSIGPIDWTYYSTRHFYESSQGTWKLLVSDEKDFPFGNVNYSELIISGVPIKDQDRDGLDDDWEQQHFGTLSSRPEEDADFDGESNMREFIAGTNPLSGAELPKLDISEWSEDYVRLEWSSRPGRSYDLLGATNAVELFNVLTNLPGSVDAGEWFVPTATSPEQFFQLRSRLD